jgi:hypothetical protein
LIGLKRGEKKMVVKSFSQGWGRVSKFKKLWLFLFLVNVIIALTLAIPMQKDLKASFGNSMVEDNMRKSFDYSWYRYFQYEGKGLSTTFFAYVGGWGAVLENLEGLVTGELFGKYYSVLIVGIIYLLLNILFAGGIIGLYHDAEAKFSLAEFFKHAGSYFWRFLRLFVISLPFYIFLVYLLIGKLSMAIFGATRDNSTEWPTFLMNLGANILALFLLCLVNMIFDYAKIGTVVKQGRSMIIQTGKAIGFVFKHFSKTLRLYYLLFLTGAVIVVIYALIEPLSNQTVLWTLILFFIIQQLFMLCKIWIRLTFYASQLELYKKLT